MKRTTDKLPETPAFAEVINLLALFSDAANRLTEIESEANAQLLEILDAQKADYATLQEAMKKAEQALEVICRTHPEWFAAAKSIKTPYGKVLLHASTSLEAVNEEATVKLLRAEAKSNPAFNAGDYIRTVETPNLEALEALPDADLAKFMVKRVRKDSFSVTPAKVDFGKAVKEALDKAA